MKDRLAEADEVMQAQAPRLRRLYSVSIVMPCLDEAETVGTCVRKALSWLEGSGYAGEVIVVDNGSTDGSPEIATEAGARVIRETRKGYGNAYHRGLAEATGDFIIMGDSDDTYDFSELDALIEPLLEGHDLVMGNRYKGGIRPGAMTWSHRYIGTPAISTLLRFSSGVRIGDSQCGMRAFTREALNQMQLRCGGMEFASEMLLEAGRRGLSVAEVPVPYYSRAGETKLSTFRDGWRHLRYLLVNTPRMAFVVPSLILLAVGLASLALLLVSPEGLQIGSTTWQPVFAGSIFVTIGANGLMLGLLSTTYCLSQGIIVKDRVGTYFQENVRLEHLLLAALGLVIIGLALDGLLLVQWLSGDHAPTTIGLAAIAQTSLIIGGQLGLAAILYGLLTESRWRA
jgi:hypothetical protein